MTKKEILKANRHKLDECVRLNGQELIDALELIRDQNLLKWTIETLNGNTAKTGAYQYGMEKAMTTLTMQYTLEGIKLENANKLNGRSNDNVMRIVFEKPAPSDSDYKVDKDA